MFLPTPQKPGYKTSHAWPVEDVTAVLPSLVIDRDEVIHVDTKEHFATKEHLLFKKE